MKIAFAKLPTSKDDLPKSGALCAGVLKDRVLTPLAELIDEATGGALKRAMGSSRFTGKKSEVLEIVSPQGLGNSRIVLVGLGDPKELDDRSLQDIGGTLVAHLNSVGEKAAAVLVSELEGPQRASAERAAEVAFGACLRSYRFDKYRTKEKPEDKPSLIKLTLLVDGPAKARRAFARSEAIADGVFMTRNLVSEPANVIYPETLAREAKALEELGVKVEILGVKEMTKLGMGALLGVGQGSAHDPRLLVMQWRGGTGRGKEKAPVAFIGKGVTFDSGGISIKPSAGMGDMKWDMGGAGVVIGLMKALAGRKAKVNAVAVAGLVENMPSGTAQRPGDIVTSLSGQTIEVLNTDAEGRLVLADALWYTQDRFKPRFMVNLATLTGAIIVALGHRYAGLFSNNDELAGRLVAAGEAVDETLWRMPLHEDYDKDIDSQAADMKNIGANRDAGSVAAAQFLQRFVNGVPWAHLDIAGVTWSTKDKPTVPKGGTGFGVRLLDRLVADHYED
jgi:leucyl aminopeptidase